MDNSEALLEEFGAGRQDAIAKLNYSHDAMIDLLIAKPGVSQRQLARHFGYTEAWVSRIISSSSFKARLSERKKELVDKVIITSIEEGFDAIVLRSQEVILQTLDASPKPDFALKALDIAAKAAGFGAKPAGAGPVQVNFLVAVPPTSKSGQEWATQYTPVPTLEGLAPTDNEQAGE